MSHVLSHVMQEIPLPIDVRFMECDSESDFGSGSGFDSGSDYGSDDGSDDGSNYGSDSEAKSPQSPDVNSRYDEGDIDKYTDSDTDTDTDTETDTDTDTDDEDDHEYYSEAIQTAMIAIQPHFALQRRIYGHRKLSVFSAVGTTDKKNVCVKVNVTNYEDPPMEARILQHIDTEFTARSWPKTHVQKLVACFHNRDTFVTVSQLERDVSFSKHITSSSIIVTVMYDLIKTLHQLHAIGIIHRDIKNSNLLFDEKTNKFVIIDFDLSTFITPSGHHEDLGTHGFMAPEIIKCQTQYLDLDLDIDLDLNPDFDPDPQTYNQLVDIWSAGVVLGGLLFRVSEIDITPEVVDTWLQISESPADCPKELFNLFKCMCQPCGSRPSAFELLQHAAFASHRRHRFFIPSLATN